MANIHHPRRGSLQIWPRVRAKRHIARIRTWHTDSSDSKLLAFIGYKAGMTHLIVRDTSPHSMYKNDDLFIPATVIECPPLRALSLCFYKKTYDGLKLFSEVSSKSITKELKKHIKLTKKEVKEPENFDEIRLKVYTQPYLLGIGKKKADIIEIGISGKDNKEKLNFAKSLLEKEIKIQDFFKDQKFFDVHSVTKGKGFQGTVKRYGVKIRQHKAEKTKRGIGTLGSWHPNKVQFQVAQAGKMGYHQRTEYNKQTLLIDSDPKKINPKSGFLHYGLIKNDYILLKGSIPGSSKRPIILTPNIRRRQGFDYQIKLINLDSKQ